VAKSETMFNYIINVQFLPETNPENIKDNEKALQTIKIVQERLNKADTGDQIYDVKVLGVVEKHGLISGQKYELVDNTDAELVQRFETALFGRQSISHQRLPDSSSTTLMFTR